MDPPLSLTMPVLTFCSVLLSLSEIGSDTSAQNKEQFACRHSGLSGRVLSIFSRREHALNVDSIRRVEPGQTDSVL